jgi:glutamate-5-semialdehyde dehydrogenase
MSVLSNSPEASIEPMMLYIGRRAREAAHTLALASTEAKNEVLERMAARLELSSGKIIEANRQDLEAAQNKGRDAAFLDRLRLDGMRVAATARGLREVAALADPVGQVMAHWTRPNGLEISRVRVPLGVIGIIYESRPNVTADAAALCLKSGNAVILRSGSESFLTSLVIANALSEALLASGLPEASIQLVPTVDRSAVGFMLGGLAGAVDVIVPRGGKDLVARVREEARVPVFAHLEGVCHVYVHKASDLDMAKHIVLNAKLRRTGV